MSSLCINSPSCYISFLLPREKIRSGAILIASFLTVIRVTGVLKTAEILSDNLNFSKHGLQKKFNSIIFIFFLF